MTAFSGAAPQRVFDLIERHQIVCEGRQDGTIRAAKSERNARTVRASAAQWSAHGAPVQVLDRDAIAAAPGTGRYVCGMADPRGGNLNPLGYARGLARAAQGAGARIHAGSPALRSVLFEVASMTVYYRLDAANRLLMGGRSPSHDTAWSHFWNGQLAVTTDHYPHFHEPAPGVLAALAYNGCGVAMATAMGTQVAARILGAAPGELDMPITGLKEIPFHGLWRSALAVRMAYGRIRDSLGQ